MTRARVATTIVAADPEIRKLTFIQRESCVMRVGLKDSRGFVRLIA